MKARVLGGPNGELVRRVVHANRQRIVLRAATSGDAWVFDARDGSSIEVPLRFKSWLHPDDVREIGQAVRECRRF